MAGLFCVFDHFSGILPGIFDWIAAASGGALLPSGHHLGRQGDVPWHLPPDVDSALVES